MGERFEKGDPIGANVGGRILLSGKMAEKLNRLVALITQRGNLDASGEVEIVRDGAGIGLVVSRRMPVYAQISGTANPYTAEERIRADDGTWETPPSPRGFDPVYEVNAQVDQDGKIQEIRQGNKGQWLFQVRRLHPSETCMGRICVHITETPCEGMGDPPGIPGQLVQVFLHGTGDYIGSCTTDSEGRCCIEVEPGHTYDVHYIDSNVSECSDTSITVGVPGCDDVDLDERVVCCGVIQLNLRDYDTGAPITDSNLGDYGYTQVADGVYQFTFTSPDGCTAKAGYFLSPISAPGYIDGCLSVVGECGQIHDYTYKMYSTERWVWGKASPVCGCEDCDEIGDRRKDVFSIADGAQTVSGAGFAGFFGPYNGATIPLNYAGIVGIYHLWTSGCLPGGGNWHCARSQTCKACQDDGSSLDVDWIKLVTDTGPDAEVDPGSPEAEDHEFGSFMATLLIPADGNDPGSGDNVGCAMVAFVNYYAADCTDDIGLPCAESDGSPVIVPVLCEYKSPHLGEDCDGGATTDDCDHTFFTYDKATQADTFQASYLPSGGCAPPDVTWDIVPVNPGLPCEDGTYPPNFQVTWLEVLP